MRLQHCTPRSRPASPSLTAVQSPLPFYLSPEPAPVSPPHPCDTAGEAMADAFPLSAALSADFSSMPALLDDAAAVKRDCSSSLPSVFAPSPVPSHSLSSSLSFPHSSAPPSSAFHVWSGLPSLTSFCSSASPGPWRSSAPASLPAAAPRFSPLWRCSLGCGQQYERSSGRSIRKHFAACFRRHWPGGEQLTEDELSALINSQQSAGLLVTGFRKWKMRCSSAIRPGLKRRERTYRARDERQDSSPCEGDDGNQDQPVELQHTTRSATAMSESSCSSAGDDSSSNTAAVTLSFYRGSEAPPQLEQAPCWSQQPREPLDAPRSAVEAHGPAASGFDGVASPSPASLHSSRWCPATQRSLDAGGEGECQSAQQLTICRIQRERCSLLRCQSERRQRLESELLQERQRQESFHMSLLFSDIYSEQPSQQRS